MKQSVLRSGQLVRYHKEIDYLNEQGFVLGRLYEVKQGKDAFSDILEFIVEGPIVQPLTKGEGFTDVANHFSIVDGSLVLPLGSDHFNTIFSYFTKSVF